MQGLPIQAELLQRPHREGTALHLFADRRMHADATRAAHRCACGKRRRLSRIRCKARFAPAKRLRKRSGGRLPGRAIQRTGEVLAELKAEPGKRTDKPLCLGYRGLHVMPAVLGLARGLSVDGASAWTNAEPGRPRPKRSRVTSTASGTVQRIAGGSLRSCAC
jgi:hypothetical protein